MIESDRVADAIRLQRERRGLTQAALASLLGVSQQAVSRWESGASVPGPAQLGNLSTALGADFRDAGEPTVGTTHVPSRSLVRALPLRHLSASQFEVFCADLVHLWAGAKPTRWGGPGHAQGGVDIVAEMPDGKLFAFQCKNRERFGPAQVAEAVAAVSVDADRYHLLLSRTASPAARAAIARFHEWTLWDDDDLSRKVRYDINRDDAIRLVDTHFPGLRQAFFDIADPGPWLTTEEYFRPFTGSGRSLSHDWDLVGRTRELGETMRRLGNHRVVVVTGPGGSGKTRLLKAVADAAEIGPRGKPVRFLAENVALEPRHLELLAAEERLVIVDDAHDRKDLALLFLGISRFARGVRVLLATRPFAEVSIRAELARCGLADHDQANEATLALPSLTINESISLSRQVLLAHQGPSERAQAVAELTIDCPLATVVGSRLMADRLAHPRMLRSEPGFRETIMRAFRDELLGRMGQTGEERDLRDLLDVVALVQPVEADDPRFARLTANIMGRTEDRIARLMGSLVASGLVRTRGRTLRIAPDVLTDCLIMEACVAQGGGHPTRFADRVFSNATAPYQLNIVRNLARLDWQMSAGTRSSLLTDIWHVIRSQFRSSSVNGRWDLLHALSDLSWFQPERAIELARLAIQEPTTSNGDDFLLRFGLEQNRNLALEGLPAFLRGAAHHPDHLPEVFQLLWQLGRDDSRPPHGYRDHPIRVLQDLASLRPDGQLIIVERAVDVASEWLRDRRLDQYAHSPFDVLDMALMTEILHAERTPGGTEVRADPVPWPRVMALRTKVVDAAFEMLTHSAAKVRRRAMETIASALRPVRASFDRQVAAVEEAGWESHALLILRRLTDTVLDLDPLLLDQIESMVCRRAKDGELVGNAKRAVRDALPKSFERMLARAIRHDWPPAIFVQGLPHEEAGPQWLQFQEEIADELCRGKLAAEVLDILSILMADLEEHSRQFFTALFRISPEVARLIVEDKLNVENSTFDSILDLAIAQWRIADLAQAWAWLREADKRDDETLIQAVLRAMGLDRTGVLPPSLDEIRIVRALGGNPHEGIRSDVAAVAGRMATIRPGLALDLISHVKIDGSVQVARSVAWQFTLVDALQVADLDDRQRRQLVNELELVVALEDEWVGRLLGALSRVAPLEVLTLLQRRVDTWQEAPTRPHQPVPFAWADGHSPLQLKESHQFTEALRVIRRWLLMHLDDRHHLFWAPQLWAAVVGNHDDQQALQCLIEWLVSPDPRELMTVSALVSHGPASFVWRRADVVVSLLDHAEGHGRDCLRRVRRDLWTCATSGVREFTPGEPSKDDLDQRDQAASIAAELPWSSPGRLFYRDLARAAEASIRAMTLMDGGWPED